MHSFDFRAISFERHGYLAEETVGFIKQLAYCRALALGLEPSAEIRRWYGVIVAFSFSSSKSGKASVENCSLSATSTAYYSILHFLQDHWCSSSAVGLRWNVQQWPAPLYLEPYQQKRDTPFC